MTISTCAEAALNIQAPFMIKKNLKQNWREEAFINTFKAIFKNLIVSIILEKSWKYFQ